MEDLLASIRKIIADDGGEGPRPTPTPTATPALKSTLPPGREPGSPRRAAARGSDLSALVEQSMLEAFSVVDADRDDPEAPRRIRPVPPAGGRGEPGMEAAVQSIAEAIAAERQGRSRRQGADVHRGGWAGAVHAEPGLDIRKPPLSRAMRPAPAPDATAAATGAAARRASHEAWSGPAARSVRPFCSDRPDGSPAEPPPPKVGRPGAERRPANTADAAADGKPQNGAGNIFQRQGVARPAAADGPPGAAARQPVSLAPHGVPRAVLANNPLTVEDLVRDMIRPMLREWLEANLPSIVERQVRQEIDRISARSR